MLADLLAPMSQQEFLGDYWTRRFVQIPGPPAKFAHLFDWDVLNRSLEQHRFPQSHVSPPRLRLVKEGRSIESERYLDADLVRGGDLMKELANGATLIFNFCDEVHPPLRDLCCHLEKLFHVYVHANLYAGWRKDNGFGVHWDDQDTLILQVSGRKHWKVWAPTRLHPFTRDVVDTSPKTKPDGPPIWDGILEPGGVLNMPRGWWHVAYPMDEPCLHLTVTVKNLNGIDMLRWFADQMKTSETARAELPVLASDTERREWLDQVWRDLAAAWTPDLIDRFVRHADRSAKSRPALRLPEVGTTSFVVSRHTALQLAIPRPLSFQAADGIARFSAAGVDWQTTSDLVPTLARFNDGLAHTVAELSPASGHGLTTLLAALVIQGVLRPVVS